MTQDSLFHMTVNQTPQAYCTAAANQPIPLLPSTQIPQSRCSESQQATPAAVKCQCFHCTCSVSAAMSQVLQQTTHIVTYGCCHQSSVLVACMYCMQHSMPVCVCVRKPRAGFSKASIHEIFQNHQRFQCLHKMTHDCSNLCPLASSSWSCSCTNCPVPYSPFLGDHGRKQKHHDQDSDNTPDAQDAQQSKKRLQTLLLHNRCCISTITLLCPTATPLCHPSTPRLILIVSEADG
jgi:hypothetical protein